MFWAKLEALWLCGQICVNKGILLQSLVHYKSEHALLKRDNTVMTLSFDSFFPNEKKALYSLCVDQKIATDPSVVPVMCFLITIIL